MEIAQKEKTTVEALLALNPQIQDASRIYPGQVIRLSNKGSMPQTGKTVTVKAGDTLSAIAEESGNHPFCTFKTESQNSGSR